MAASAPSEYLALREIGAERGSLTPPSPAVQGDQTTDTMRLLEACLTRLSARLIELERETGAANPNPKWVLEQQMITNTMSGATSIATAGIHVIDIVIDITTMTDVTIVVGTESST
jgi:hypothetical protein